jgi:hypothetical protein
MCEMCDSPEGMASCPECGRLICWDVEYVDDVIAPAAVSASGDLMCLPCAIRCDEEEEEWEDEDYYPGPWDD